MSSRKEADGAGRWLQQHVTASSGSPAPATVLLLGSVFAGQVVTQKMNVRFVFIFNFIAKFE